MCALDNCYMAERARALAFYGRGGALGSMPASWPSVAAAASVAAQTDETSCPVCLDDFADLLPSPDPSSRAPPGRWAEAGVRCPHAVCRECDAGLQRSTARCPICRRARLERVSLP